MKKISLLIVLLFGITVVFAQEEVKAPKRDYSVFFPKQGSIVLGADMSQFVKFIGGQTFGRISGDTEDQAVGAFQNDFFGKYFLDKNLALRARLGFNVNNFTRRGFVRDDNAYFTNPSKDPETKTVDTWKQRNLGFELGIGAELRRSLWRLQGYVGGEVFIGYGYTKDEFIYGNPIADGNTNPSVTTDFQWATFAPGGGRILKSKDSYLTYGASVFTGVDYFFCKNLSLGLEFSLQGIAFYFPEVVGITEKWEHDQVYTRKNPDMIKPTRTSFGIQPITYLNLHFYF